MSLRALLALLCLAWLPMPAAAQTPVPDGRQRLALVVGIGQVGQRTVLPSAARDAPAVAAALAGGGYEVLLRENPSAADLRAAFQAFRSRLKPDALGVIYLTGPMAQVDGRNLIVPSDVVLNEAAQAAATAALLRVVGVPVQEALAALAGAPEAPRVLVLDGAYRIAPLASLVPAGLARQRTPDGTMVLLGHLPAALHDAPAAEPAPADAQDPQRRAATRLARALADALTLSGVTVAEALRAVRLEVLDASGGRTQPALSGSVAGRVDFAQKPPPPAATAASATAAAAPPAGAAAAITPPAAAAAAATPPAAATAAATPASAAIAAASAPAAADPAPAAAAAAAAASAPVAPVTDGRTERAPGQGERPVFQTRSNSFGHAEGDVLSYQRVDTVKDEVLASYVIAIDRIEDSGLLRANGGLWQLDAEGRPVRVQAEDGSETRFEPAEAWWWARARAGDARPLQFTEIYRRADRSQGRIAWRGQAQVGPAQVLPLPGGEVAVLPIRSTGQATDTPEGPAAPALTFVFSRVVYFAPKLGVPVAVDIEDSDTAGRPIRRERIELTHAQQARTLNP